VVKLTVTLTPAKGQETKHSEAPADPRLSQLVGFSDLARETGLSYWTFHNAYRRGEISGWHVPGGAVGLYRPEAESFTARHRKRLKEKAAKKSAQGHT